MKSKQFELLYSCSNNCFVVCLFLKSPSTASLCGAGKEPPRKLWFISKLIEDEQYMLVSKKNPDISIKILGFFKILPLSDGVGLDDFLCGPLQFL